MNGRTIIEMVWITDRIILGIISPNDLRNIEIANTRRGDKRIINRDTTQDTDSLKRIKVNIAHRLKKLTMIDREGRVDHDKMEARTEELSSATIVTD